MAKTKISEYSSTAAGAGLNTDIANINIDEGCSPSGINNAIRSLMAQVKDLQSGASGDTIPIAAGGTGATTAATARAALSSAASGANSDITSITGLTTALTVAQGGTGITNNPNVLSITFIIDGGGSTITTGIKGDLTIPFACTISEWTLLANQSGSIVVDIWKDTYSNYPPTVGDTITGSAKPTISTATKGQSSTLTGWTTSITAGNILRFNVDSVSSITRVTLSLKVTRT